MSEMVNHPSHYNIGKIEVIDVIEDWNLGFNDGNAVKYIARHQSKGRPAEDLKKALWYIARELVSRYHIEPVELSKTVLLVKKEPHALSAVPIVGDYKTAMGDPTMGMGISGSFGEGAIRAKT